MSAFMIDREEYLAFAVRLHRFCNAPMPPHHTCELLRSLWWIPPANTASTWDWRVNRLVRLMMLANQRAVWHRYSLGRTDKDPSNGKFPAINPSHCYHQTPLTDAELMSLYKFTACALYQASEWTGGPEQAPRLVKLMQQLQGALGQDVLTHLSLWGKAPWGSVT
ncbi:hypothetical protein [Aeromonas media]|uniref:hypothetical protein n=1 Tax=Aeromonas media TaxID=651 RepID=UPI0029557FC3|nr:hypothetical protein [Aeromonas media]WOQ14083.1 hypothetical protein R2X36_04190 [Aeromonas media]